jgi:hypothetical protein
MENKTSRKSSKMGERKPVTGAHTTRCGLDTSLVNAKDTLSGQTSRRNNPRKTKRKHTYRSRQLLNMTFSSDSDEDSNTDGEHSHSDHSVQTEYISDSDNDSNTS